MSVKRVLVVEDNDNNLYLMRFILTKLGHEVLEARDGLAGVETARRERPDLVLVDIQLPVLDGYEATRRMRSDPELAQTPIIAVTSYAMVADRDKALAAGCTAYLEKPIQPKQFIKELEKYL